MSPFRDPLVRGALLSRARRLVETAAAGLPDVAPLPPAVAEIPVNGLFVTLRRGGELRGCIGSYRTDASGPVGGLLDEAAPGAALRDPRFPPVEPDEAPELGIELTALHSFRRVEGCGEERAGAVEVGRHGVLVRALGRRGLLLPQVASERGWDSVTFLGRVCEKAGLPAEAWRDEEAELFTFEGEAFAEADTLAAAEAVGGAAPEPPARPPAVAGRFYPAAPEGIAAELDRRFAPFRGALEKPARAVMLPHAGWLYCGDLVASALARVRVPEFAVVLGPKHTPYGPEWSVSAAGAWEWPGGRLEVAGEWADFLVARCPGLVRENEAHREEHGCEVLLPFLHRRNASVRVVPVAIGAAGYEDLGPLAETLAAMRAELGERVLFVISSDMNHFADEAENRRRDALALERFEAADARGLFEVCLRNRISMCGLRPAAAVLRALARESAPEVELVAYETSARVTGDTRRVVGYASAVLS